MRTVVNRTRRLERSRTSQKGIEGNADRHALGFRSLAVTASVARTNEGNGDGNATERPQCGAQGSGGRPRTIPLSAGAGRSCRERSALNPKSNDNPLVTKPLATCGARTAAEPRR